MAREKNLLTIEKGVVLREFIVLDMDNIWIERIYLRDHIMRMLLIYNYRLNIWMIFIQENLVVPYETLDCTPPAWRNWHNSRSDNNKSHLEV